MTRLEMEDYINKKMKDATQPHPATMPPGSPLRGDTKPSNPKAGVGATKVPLFLVPPICKAYAALAHFLGWMKYGAWNWRAAGVSVSTYVGALHRHIDRYWEGEWYDSDGTPHLANALACINILIEGHHRKNITDDRPPSTNLQPVYDELEKIQKSIMEKYGNINPRHYTKADGFSV